MTYDPTDADGELDPVSHRPVNPDRAAAKSFYHGRTYYFESRVNKDTFDDDPQLWISTPHASMTSASLRTDE